MFNLSFIVRLQTIHLARQNISPNEFNVSINYAFHLSMLQPKIQLGWNHVRQRFN